MVALFLLLAAADFRFVKDPAGWQLLREGKPVQEIQLADFVTYEVPANWRGPARAARKAGGIGKMLYAAFLKKRHGYQIATLNQAYGLDVSSFTELEAMDFTGLDENRPEVLADDIAYVGEIYKERIQGVLYKTRDKLKLVELPGNLPPGLAIELGELADAVILQAPVPGMMKPLVVLNCPAVKPAFATACARI